jgi:secreted trypsin-like serine protease
MEKSDASKLDEDLTIREAIEYAEKYAAADDEAYIRALNEAYRGAADTGMRHTSPLRVLPADAPDMSFQIYKDPRYLQNARELARRALGGIRVIGGKPVREGEFLDCVAVGSDAQWACSGTLVGPNVVLTAGHCAAFATRVFFGNDVTKSGKVVAVRQRVPHPKYRQGKHNDLMVLLLQERVTTVQPRKMASKSLIDGTTDGRVVGFGNVDPRGLFGYGLKRMVDVPIASPDCRGTVEGHDDSLSYGCDRGLEIVAGRPLLERDSCKGDSGGPFYVLDGTGQWQIAGATSRATDSAMHTCGDGGIYVRVDRYRAWIASIPGAELS